MKSANTPCCALQRAPAIYVLPLAFLAADIVEAIAAGRQPVELTAQRLIKRAVLTVLPLDWKARKGMLGIG